MGDDGHCDFGSEKSLDDEARKLGEILREAVNEKFLKNSLKIEFLLEIRSYSDTTLYAIICIHGRTCSANYQFFYVPYRR